MPCIGCGACQSKCQGGCQASCQTAIQLWPGAWTCEISHTPDSGIRNPGDEITAEFSVYNCGRGEGIVAASVEAWKPSPEEPEIWERFDSSGLQMRNMKPDEKGIPLLVRIRFTMPSDKVRITFGGFHYNPDTGNYDQDVTIESELRPPEPEEEFVKGCLDRFGPTRSSFVPVGRVVNAVSEAKNCGTKIGEICAWIEKNGVKCGEEVCEERDPEDPAQLPVIGECSFNMGAGAANLVFCAGHKEDGKLVIDESKSIILTPSGSCFEGCEIAAQNACESYCEMFEQVIPGFPHPTFQNPEDTYLDWEIDSQYPDAERKDVPKEAFIEAKEMHLLNDGDPGQVALQVWDWKAPKGQECLYWQEETLGKWEEWSKPVTIDLKTLGYEPGEDMDILLIAYYYDGEKWKESDRVGCKIR